MQDAPHDWAESVTRTTVSFQLSLLGFTIEQSTSRTDKKINPRKRNKTAFAMRLPAWFLQEQYDIQFIRATSRMLFHLEVCSIVSENSPIFQACYDCDIEKLKMLITTRQASIYDRTPAGDALFLYAVNTCQVEICALPRQLGIFARFRSPDYARALSCLSYGMSDFSERRRSLLRLMQPQDTTDVDWYIECCVNQQTFGSCQQIAPYTSPCRRQFFG